MIDGVVVTPLKQITDERGTVMHMLKSTDSQFESFGEIYFSSIYPNVVKAWHYHKEMTINYAVPCGRIRFVLFDDRRNSPTRGQVQQIELGPNNYCLVSVPPKIWNGFQGLGNEIALVANCTSIPHDPSEIERLDQFDSSIPYQWDVMKK